MKVKVITNYIDKLLKKELTVGQIIEVESEERLQELLGANKNKIVCVEVIDNNELSTEAHENQLTSKDSSNELSDIKATDKKQNKSKGKTNAKG